MFGKNYDNEINMLIEQDTKTLKQILETKKMITTVLEDIGSNRESMIQLAKVQAKHKESITFLLNHATVDADAQKDFIKLLKSIKELEEMY